MTWKGRPWLAVNRANEIQLWDVVDPRHPAIRASSNFNVGNQGDSDSDLVAFAVCDDCRWGVAWYKLATVVFDLGTGTQPTWADHERTYGAIAGQGGATWYHGRDQWLATASFGGSACTGSTLYTLAGLSDRTAVGCITAGSRTVTAVRGVYDRGSVYLTDSTMRLYHYLAGGAGLAYQRQIGAASYGGNSWSGLDAVPGLLVAASAQGTTLYDTADPALPIPTATIPGNAAVATVQPPLLVVGLFIAGDQHRERVYDLTEPGLPMEVTADLWPDVHPCTAYQSSTLTGEVLTSWRWSIAESFDLEDCVEPAPVALIFADGFDSGSTSAWDEVVP